MYGVFARPTYLRLMMMACLQQPLKRISEGDMKQVLHQATQRVSCTFDAFADDVANTYIATHQQQPRLVRHDAMLKQARWRQWAVRVTSDPVCTCPPATLRLACKVVSSKLLLVTEIVGFGQEQNWHPLLFSHLFS